MESANLKPVESVAGVLERELPSTIAEWLRCVNLIPDLAAIALSNTDRTGHLPQLFKDLIARLRLDRDSEPPSSIAAAEYGKARFAQGYSVSMLVEDSRIFQVSTFGTLHTHQSKLDQDQVQLTVITIADEADRQLTQSVSSFMAAQAAA
jgi:hypothetical protein